MNKYKININRTPPTTEDIQKLRNFDYVLNHSGSHVIPFYRSLWFISSAAAIFILGLLGGLYYLGRENSPMANEQPFIINTPIAIEYDLYKVDCTDSTGIITPSGTIIQIPKGSLVDTQGKMVTGNIELKYMNLKMLPILFAVASQCPMIAQAQLTFLNQPACLI